MKLPNDSSTSARQRWARRGSASCSQLRRWSAASTLGAVGHQAPGGRQRGQLVEQVGLGQHQVAVVWRQPRQLGQQPQHVRPGAAHARRRRVHQHPHRGKCSRSRRSTSAKRRDQSWWAASAWRAARPAARPSWSAASISIRNLDGLSASRTSGAKPLQRRQVGGDHGHARGEVLVGLDGVGMIGHGVGHERDQRHVHRGQVARHVGVRTWTEQVHVGQPR